MSADVNSGHRIEEVSVVSVEENGKSKKYRTYRDLESLKARKEQTEKLNKGNLSPSLYPSMPHGSDSVFKLLFCFTQHSWHGDMEHSSKIT